MTLLGLLFLLAVVGFGLWLLNRPGVTIYAPMLQIINGVVVFAMVLLCIYLLLRFSGLLSSPLLNRRL